MWRLVVIQDIANEMLVFLSVAVSCVGFRLDPGSNRITFFADGPNWAPLVGQLMARTHINDAIVSHRCK